MRPLIHQYVFLRNYLEFEVLFVIKGIIYDMAQRVFELFTPFSANQQALIKHELTTAEHQIKDLLNSSLMVNSKEVFEDCHRVLENSVYQLMAWVHSAVNSGLISEEVYIEESDLYDQHFDKVIKYFADLNREIRNNFVFEKRPSAFDIGACLIYHFPFLVLIPPHLILEIATTSKCFRMSKHENDYSCESSSMAVPFLVHGQLQAKIEKKNYLITTVSQNPVLLKIFFLKQLGHEVVLSEIKQSTLLLVKIQLFWKIVDCSEYLLTELCRTVAELFLLEPELIGVQSALPDLISNIKRENPKVTFDELFEVSMLSRLVPSSSPKDCQIETDLRLKSKEQFEVYLATKGISHLGSQATKTVIVTIFGRALRITVTVERQNQS